jgi:chromosomal replication initiation ATPase DnaA
MHQQNKISFSYKVEQKFPPFHYGKDVPRSRITPIAVAKFAAEVSNIPPLAVVTRSRNQQLDRCKHLIAFCVHKLRPEMSFQQIGVHLGGKDRTTITNSISRAISLRLFDREFFDLSEYVLAHFRSQS